MAKNHAAATTSNVDESPDRFRAWALAGLTIVLIGLCVVVSLPFLPSITWGVALAIIAWPLHQWMSRHIGQPSLAAGASTLVVVIGILVPGVWVSYQLAHEAGNAVQQVSGESTGETSLRDKLTEVPGLSQVVGWMEQVNFDFEAEARNVIDSSTKSVTGLAQGSVTAVIQFLVAVFILFFVFQDHKHFLKSIRNLLPLTVAESQQVFRRVEDSVHANLYAAAVTSLINAISGGTMFWLLGLSAPYVWAGVMFVLGLLPIVGIALVWIPAAGYLALTGSWPSALILVAWGVMTFVIVDNMLYVRMAGKRMRMHQVPALIAFLGGLAVFGVSGMILGPAILAVTIAILEVWRDRAKSPAAEVAS